MLYLRGETWWTKIHQDGRPFYESTGTKDERKARKILHDRLTRAESGTAGTPESFLRDLRRRREGVQRALHGDGARDLTEAGYRLAHLDRYFRGRRLASIGTRDSEAYARKRQAQGGQ